MTRPYSPPTWEPYAFSVWLHDEFMAGRPARPRRPQAIKSHRLSGNLEGRQLYAGPRLHSDPWWHNPWLQVVVTIVSLAIVVAVVKAAGGQFQLS